MAARTGLRAAKTDWCAASVQLASSGPTAILSKVEGRDGSFGCVEAKGVSESVQSKVDPMKVGQGAPCRYALGAEPARQQLAQQSRATIGC